MTPSRWIPVRPLESSFTADVKPDGRLYMVGDHGRRPGEPLIFQGSRFILARYVESISSYAGCNLPKRINKAIELLEQGQPIYYVGVSEVSYDVGREMAGTWADYINVSMEHGAFDMRGLAEFMRGTGRRRFPRPAGTGRRPSSWICRWRGRVKRRFAPTPGCSSRRWPRGVHGILLCHADDPEGVRAFVQSCRYPFRKPAAGHGDGRRGAGGQGWAAQLWGLPVNEYLEKADPWPLNPAGELMLGVKIENKRALANAEATAQVQGLAFGEWGPGDMGMSLGHADRHDPPYPPEMGAARARVMAACKDAGLFFLNGANTGNVTEMIDEGVMICSGGGEAVAKVGRAYTGRK